MKIKENFILPNAQKIIGHRGCDKVVGEELLKHITTNFDLYKMYSDNKEFREDFNAMMFAMVKEILNKKVA